jgi:putative ABC transport system substrate-binding protein
MMRRREFIAGLGVVAWPLAARAQQPAMPVVGYLDLGPPEMRKSLVGEFRKGLSETGYVEGRNLAIEYRFAYNQFDRLPELAADLVRRGWPSLLQGQRSPRLLPKLRPRPSPSSSKSARTRCKPAWSPASTDREEISPARPR